MTAKKAEIIDGGANPYPTTPAVAAGELPDLFAGDDGVRVTSPQQWPARAAAWRDLIVEMEYGGLPPAPQAVEVETLCHSGVRRWPGAPRLWTYRVHCHGGRRPFSFCVRILFPQADGPVPAVIDGDGCWWYVSEQVAQMVTAGGCALVMFNRTEMAEDLGYAGVPDPRRRAGGLVEAYPDETFGALAAWAWGYHRVVDLLERLDFIDAARIAVTGHSRGGKTALLAGATDERIAMVNDNASCAGGGATFRYVGHGGETINIVNTFPSWFGPKMRPWVGRESELPFDQHCLLATVAPRPLLLTYALDDRWSNPEGMVQCAWAAGEAYAFLDARERLAFHLRPGEHSHDVEDWRVLMDFVGRHFFDRPAGVEYNRHPYTHLRPAFSWRAPGS